MNHHAGHNIGQQRLRQVGSKHEGRLGVKRVLNAVIFGGILECMWAWRCHKSFCRSSNQV